MGTEPREALDDLAHDAIGAAIEVHRHLGPGFSESVYEEALCKELSTRGLPHERQVRVDVMYKGDPVGSGKLDLVLGGELILELKSVRELIEVHRTQLYSYLRATEQKLGLLMNFNAEVLKDGLVRVVNDRAD
jgi:GxxExxY protein